MYSKSSIQRILLIFLPAALFFQICTAPAAWAGERICVAGSIANLRSGPGTNHQVLWQVEKYHPLLIEKKQGNWYQVKDFEGDTAWLHNSLVTNVESVITVKAKCNVRKGPGTKNPIVFTTERGVPFKVLKKQGNWLNIEHADGDIGWIHNSLIW